MCLFAVLEVKRVWHSQCSLSSELCFMLDTSLFFCKPQLRFPEKCLLLGGRWHNFKHLPELRKGNDFNCFPRGLLKLWLLFLHSEPCHTFTYFKHLEMHKKAVISDSVNVNSAALTCCHFAFTTDIGNWFECSWKADCPRNGNLVEVQSRQWQNKLCTQHLNHPPKCLIPGRWVGLSLLEEISHCFTSNGTTGQWLETEYSRSTGKHLSSMHALSICTWNLRIQVSRLALQECGSFGSCWRLILFSFVTPGIANYNSVLKILISLNKLKGLSLKCLQRV